MQWAEPEIVSYVPVYTSLKHCVPSGSQTFSWANGPLLMPHISGGPLSTVIANGESWCDYFDHTLRPTAVVLPTGKIGFFLM